MGVSFLPRADFLVPHFGSFWEKVRDQFPNASHAPPVIEQEEGQVEDGYFLPRIWLASKDNATLLQLQQNRFHFNWREVEGQGNKYIRYTNIRDEFLRLWKLFSEFVVKETGLPLQPTGFEITYVNFIEAGEQKDPLSFAKKIFRSISFPLEGANLGKSGGFQYQYHARLSKEVGDLAVVYGSAARNKKLGIKLDLTVRNKQVGSENFESWVEEAHKVILAAFKEITTSEMHRVWQMREE